MPTPLPPHLPPHPTPTPATATRTPSPRRLHPPHIGPLVGPPTPPPVVRRSREPPQRHLDRHRVPRPRPVRTVAGPGTWLGPRLLHPRRHARPAANRRRTDRVRAPWRPDPRGPRGPPRRPRRAAGRRGLQGHK